MSEARTHSPPPRSPPPPDAKRPKGILKRASHHSPPPPTPPPATLPSTETADHPLTDKELTLHNTAVNAGRRRSSSVAQVVSRRQSSRTPSHQGEANPDEDETAMRLKWDEVNLYLTEQDRTAKMKIDEPKTPYAKHYDPSEDMSDDAGLDGEGDGGIPGLSLGEPEEEVPEGEFERRPSKVQVDDSSVSGSVHGDDNALVGLSAEEREKHKRFEDMRKKHYEMRDVAHLLGHSEELEELADEDEDEDVPPLPKA